MPDSLSDSDWDGLLRRIKRGKCTPFLGAGASSEAAPVGSALARRWAEEHDYPLSDAAQLSRVAQFLAVEHDAYYPREILQQEFEGLEPPDFRRPDSPHGVLADLELPLYLTTNYDDFMEQAIEDRKRPARTELCEWNDYIEFEADLEGAAADEAPSPTKPVVYHLHGHYQTPQSLVLTEDDYLNYLVRLSHPDQDMLPHYVKKALAGTSLLFVGYSLADWSFRVLFRGLVNSLGVQARMVSIAVQLSVEADASDPAAIETAKAYMDRYFSKIQEIEVRTYWGTAAEFAKELKARWEAFG